MNYLIFVYGTLKGSLPKNMLVGSGKIKGRLFDLGFYPGAIESDDGIIQGEIYSVDEKTLHQFDGYEGYKNNDPFNSLFYRKVVTATTYDCKEVSVHVYFYNIHGELGHLIESKKEILSGNWTSQFS